jgi:polyisoprenoid-binding protein YceI
MARIVVGLLLALGVAGPLPAEPLRLVLDPAATRIRFDVDSTLHRVRGTARLEAGEFRFDRGGGHASGRVVIDARSLETGNGLRDGVLHEDVLESERFPRIVFLPEDVEVLRIEDREADVRVSGRIDIHGSRHPLTIPGRVRVDGERLELEARFQVPYVAWGMRDPGNFLLRVDDVVNVEVEAVGRVSPTLP